MFRISQAVVYSVAALAHIAKARDSGPRRVADIAAHCHIPQDYLSKLLQQLSRAGIVRGARGRRGGFSLQRPPRQINLLEIMEAVEPSPQPPLPRAETPRAGSRALARLAGVADRAAGDLCKVLQRTTLQALIAR